MMRSRNNVGGPRFSENSGSLAVSNRNYFFGVGPDGEGETGTYTWYYRVNVVNNGAVVSSDIGQLDIILEGANDVATAAASTVDSPQLYDKTNSGQGNRITTAVTSSKDRDTSIVDPDAGDTVSVQKIRLYARLNGSTTEKNAALDTMAGETFYLYRGQSTDDSNWGDSGNSDDWGVLSDHFAFNFNSDGTLEYVSKRDSYRSAGGSFDLRVVEWTEHVGGVDSVETNIDRTDSIDIRSIYYSANTVEFVDDAVAVSSSAGGSGSVADNDSFFTSLQSFKRATGSPLPTWVKVDQKTGLTTADPPPGAQPFEMRVVAEDGAGNARAIDLVLDPTLIVGEGDTNTEPANDKVANNVASDSTIDAIPATIENNLPRPSAGSTSGNNLSSSTVDVLNDGRVIFGDTPAAANGSLKLMRMVNETDGIKIEINDDAQESATRYEVRQKDGSAAPDWVKVDARTGQLTIEAPQNIGSIELTIVALDGGQERRLDVDVDLEETRSQPLGNAQDAGQDDLDGVDDQTGDGQTGELGSDGTLPVSGFVPFDAQIDKALSENSYGRDIQQAAQSLS
ncbi:hypothetical protein N9S27_02420 [Alphaproteobacteria bacterium]|nr:hypothetical protein [Alphaproteobacteria bacterium]